MLDWFGFCLHNSIYGLSKPRSQPNVKVVKPVGRYDKEFPVVFHFAVQEH